MIMVIIVTNYFVTRQTGDAKPKSHQLLLRRTAAVNEAVIDFSHNNRLSCVFANPLAEPDNVCNVC